MFTGEGFAFDEAPPFFADALKSEKGFDGEAGENVEDDFLGNKCVVVTTFNFFHFLLPSS